MHTLLAFFAVLLPILKMFPGPPDPPMPLIREKKNRPSPIINRDGSILAHGYIHRLIDGGSV